MYSKSEKLLKRALKAIPLGSQTFSKSLTQYPKGVSPFFISHGMGSKVWDIDGNKYIDFVNSLASITIGYCDDGIDKAVKSQMQNGVIFSLPHPLEIEVAERLIDIIPCAQKVRFAKNGTDATSAAIRIARAYTGRENIAVCGYHGWQDWYIGATSMDLGVPRAVKELTHTFKYNNIESLEVIINSVELACIIMEPMNTEYPNENFLERVKELAHQNNALLIFDETITGFRFSLGGAQSFFNVIPDLATFGKGMANGYPLSAVVGSNKVMKEVEKIFFSGTFGGEALSLASANAVIGRYQTDDVAGYLADTGKYLLEKLNPLIIDNNLNNFFYTSGHPSWSFINFKEQNKYSIFEIKTLFLQEMFKRGILILGSHNLSLSHNKNDINQLLSVYAEVLPLISESIQNCTLLDKIDGDILKPLFKVR